MTIRLLIADDQPLMRAAFDMTFLPEPDIEIVGEAVDGWEAVEKARRLRPDVILMDVRMPELDGVEATRILASEDAGVKILAITTFNEDEYVIQAIRAGASGFLLKDVHQEELVRAVRVVARGDALLAPSATRLLVDRFAAAVPAERPRSSGSRALAALTPSEVKVLTLVGRGLTNDEIAGELFVAVTTVRTHLRHILEKLELRDRIQAVVFAHDAGLVNAAPA